MRDLRLLGAFTNTLFRVRALDGRSYVLRICAPGWRDEEDLRAELAWLSALQSEPDIPAPVPLPARGGAGYVLATAPGLQPLRCALFSWLPGVPLARRLSPQNLYKMGELFARLHRFSAAFTPPPGFTHRRMDSPFSRGEQALLFSDACQDALIPLTRDLLARTAARVQAAFARRYADSAGLRVIHNDLWHGNILVHRGRLYPLDFEDTLWGYPVQDLAMALHDLMNDVPADDFEPLQAALRRGYESLQPWPEAYPGEVDAFRAGRVLWVANYVAVHQRPHLADFLEGLAPQLARFLESGLLRKPPAA